MIVLIEEVAKPTIICGATQIASVCKIMANLTVTVMRYHNFISVCYQLHYFSSGFYIHWSVTWQHDRCSSWNTCMSLLPVLFHVQSVWMTSRQHPLHSGPTSTHTHTHTHTLLAYITSWGGKPVDSGNKLGEMTQNLPAVRWQPDLCTLLLDNIAKKKESWQTGLAFADSRNVKPIFI